MSIRMKEWGMLALPGQPVRVPTQGITGWLGAARAFGDGLSDALSGGVDLHKAMQQEQQQVNRAGELAAFSQRLRSISEELREELQEQPAQDWDSAWESAAAPRFAEAVEELSAESREGGLELARVYSAQSCIEARRDRELQDINEAREQWQQRVEESVSAGEGEQAARWLEAGRGLFVAEDELPARQEELRRRAALRQWESRLQVAPLETLAELARREASGELGAEERRALRPQLASARRALQQELAAEFSQAVLEDDEPAASRVELAARAGLLPPLPASEKPAPAATPTAATRSAWRRWVDGCAEGEKAEAAVRLRLATAPLPLAERRELLRRMERSAGIPAADRRTLSNGLMELYHLGAFGCPGDDAAQRALLALQDEGLSLLAGQGAEGAADWLAALRRRGDAWVCFDNAH